MPGVVRSLAASAAVLVAFLALGCATTVDVSFDDRHDFSRYRTWDWLPEASAVDAQPDEVGALHALLGRLVGQELRGRGLVRAHVDADLWVSYTLRVQRQLVESSETGAENLLASHHSSPSYLVQSSTKRTDVYHNGYLRIVVGDWRGGEIVDEVIWEGELFARRKGDFTPHVAPAVARLLRELPTRPEVGTTRP